MLASKQATMTRSRAFKQALCWRWVHGLFLLLFPMKVVKFLTMCLSTNQITSFSYQSAHLSINVSPCLIFFVVVDFLLLLPLLLLHHIVCLLLSFLSSPLIFFCLPFFPLTSFSIFPLFLFLFIFFLFHLPLLIFSFFMSLTSFYYFVFYLLTIYYYLITFVLVFII